MNKPKIIQIIDVVSNAIAGNRIDEDFIKSCIYGKWMRNCMRIF